MKECTFKPNIPKEDLSKSVMSKLDQTGVTNTQPKYEELYNRAKAKKGRQDKTKEEYEYERNKEECTFQPSIKPNMAAMRSKANVSVNLNNEDLNKYQDRMNKAREERERKKKFTERGEVMPSELVRKPLNSDIEQSHSPKEMSKREDRSLTPSPDRNMHQQELGIVNLDH